MDLLSEHGYRQDGRKPNQIRNINCRLGVYSQADGSAYLEQGNTKVLAAVYGPHEAKQRSRILEDQCLINCQYSMATFSTSERKYRPRGDRKSTELTRHLEKTFNSAVLTTMYPRSQIDIFCEVLQSDGGNLAACINAASLALVDAGVPMRGIVSAAICGATDGQPCIDLNAAEESANIPRLTPCIDLNAAEESANIPRLTVATLPGGDDDLLLLELDHRVHHDQLEAIIDAAVKGAAQVHACLQTAIRKHVSEVATCLQWENS
uniref:Putative exosome complex component RRP41 n=1 Tax=Plectus sambesii TaxID=2011161 RepID=A0A914UH32_9BILA